VVAFQPIDKDRVDVVLRGGDPFNELTMVDSEDRAEGAAERVPASV
jgi:hypothetical protein